MKKTSGAWSTSRLSCRPSEPAYYIVDCRIFDPMNLKQLHEFFNPTMLVNGAQVLGSSWVNTHPFYRCHAYRTNEDINEWIVKKLTG